jgi:hypothetical protein
MKKDIDELKEAFAYNQSYNIYCEIRMPSMIMMYSSKM